MLLNIKSLAKKYKSFITYAVVGVINSSVSFIVFSIAVFLGIHVVLAQALAYMLGLICSFFLNKYFTFKNTVKSLWQVFLFLLVNGVTMSVSMAAIYLFHVIIGIQEYIANIFFVAPIVMVLNYTGFRYIVFVDVKTTKATEEGN